MNSIEWICKPFNQLGIDELYEIMRLRINVFVVEQSCPYSELDDKDRQGETLHIMGITGHQLIGYARILAPGISYKEPSIGRLVVDHPFRHQGIGHQLVLQCLKQIQTHWSDSDVRISAQQYLKAFYQNFGFSQISDGYLEDGIEHIEMLRIHPHPEFASTGK